MLPWALATFVKGMKFRLHKELAVHFGLSDKSSSVEIADGLVNLWLIMVGMGFGRV